MTGRSADLLAQRILIGYRDYRRRFAEITRRAWRRFETRDWAEAQDDSRERILLYDVMVHETLLAIRDQATGRPTADDARLARDAFAEWARDREDCEVAETFFNSVVRRMLGTLGVDPETEFVASAVDQPAPAPGSPRLSLGLDDGYETALDQVLETLPFRAPWHERRPRVARAAELIRREIGPEAEWAGGALEMLRPAFFRNKAAYLVGRFVRPGRSEPLVVALTHPPRGIQLDAVLPTGDEASVTFGFTRSYLHADIGAPRPVVEFLRSIMPLKRVDELYTAIGFHRHGKTELYRALVEHLRTTDGRFEPTPGQPGLVMSVFAYPDLNVVFKVIRDRFDDPKRTTGERVKANYRMVFVRDRVGRLADAQPFERLELPADRFDPAVLDDLLRTAGRSVTRRDDTVTIDHLYTERRVRPLDIYLAEVDREEALRVIIDLGQAIKDLAAADIFPGDMLIKNFGVTRHGRVIFYDYDEIAPLSECTIRRIPPEPYPEAELAGEPEYFVGASDLFPEEWRAFLGPPGPLRHELHRAHPELFDPDWWRAMQARNRAGDVVDFFPYAAERRLD
jgi:isocitrate dehydrogenase kinase/phosphatase